MSDMSHPAEIRDALRDVAPVIVAIFPFGVLFGALAQDAGLTLTEAAGFSAATYAGASQLVILQLVALGSPIWSILVAAVAINFRHVLYSASVGRKLTRFDVVEKALAFYILVDPLFAATETRALNHVITKRFYFAFGITTYLSWLLATIVGTLFGSLIGDQRTFGLDVLLPIYFLALTLTFRRRPGFLPVFVVSALVSILVYLTLGAPWHVTFGGLAGIATAVLRAPGAAPGTVPQDSDEASS